MKLSPHVTGAASVRPWKRYTAAPRQMINIRARERGYEHL